jgi:hypothetical protein
VADYWRLDWRRNSWQCRVCDGAPCAPALILPQTYSLLRRENLLDISTPLQQEGRPGAMTDRDRTTARRWRIGVAAGTLFVPLLLSRTHADGPRCLFRMSFLALSFRHHPFGLPVFLLCWLVLVGDLGRLPHFGAKFAQLWKIRRVTVGVTTVLLGLWAARLALAAHGSSYFIW